MITKERYDSVSGDDEPVVMTCTGSAPHTNDPGYLASSFRHFGYPKNFERMTPNSTGSQRDWKSFEHYKSRQSSSGSSLQQPFITKEWGENHIHRGISSDCRTGYELWHSSGTAAWPYGSVGELNTGLPSWTAYLPDGHFIPAPANLEKLVSDSLRVMMPGIKAELSLLNSIYELKDFKNYASVLKKIWQRVEVLKPALQRWQRIAKRGAKATLSELTRTTAGGFLQWKFAIEPLLSDISSIKSALLRTEKRIIALLQRAGRPQRRHYSLCFQEYENVEQDGTVYGVLQPDIWPFQPCTSHRVNRRVFYEPTVFHAEIEYSYYLSQFQTVHAQLLGHLDALGVNSNPAIIWNAIPWTFVVDWVIGVNRWLDSMKTRNLEPQVNVRRYLWSVKRQRRIFCTRETVWSEFPSRQQPTSTPLPVVIESAYRRHVGIPSWSSFFTSGLSSRELILGAALIIVRRPRNRRR